jgi:DNA polymerase-4
MNEALNTAEPQIMHIDLNSCFAMVEQQARPHLRGKPLGVTNRITKHACMIALSYEAKAHGAKVGMRRDEVMALVPDLLVLETDPPKYHYVYQKLVTIMKSYSPNVVMKSIDEGIIDFTGTRAAINRRSLEDIGLEIKQRLKDEVGSWMTCNVGIAPNRFLAKLAAGQNKPDGLTRIDQRNVRYWLGRLQLTDLPGIASHFEARLIAAGIYTPLQFLDTPVHVLHSQVFRSKNGEDWHQRLRGYEVDDYTTKLGIVGRQYVLDGASKDQDLLLNRLAHLSYSAARKLRFNARAARGIYVYARMQTGDYWQQRKMFKSAVYTDQAIFERAVYLFNERPKHLLVKEMGVSCYGLDALHQTTAQGDLFGQAARAEDLTEAIDETNDRYGAGTITFAIAIGAHKQIKQKLPFGSIKYFELLCSSQ